MMQLKRYMVSLMDAGILQQHPGIILKNGLTGQTRSIMKKKIHMP